MRIPVLLVSALLASAATTPFQADETRWRRDYEASLKLPDGWLSVPGLFWLHEGANRVGSDAQTDVVLPVRFPRNAGTLMMTKGKVTWEGKTLRSNAAAHPDVVTIGDATFTIIERGGKTGLRLRNPQAETRRNFTGCTWFPADEKWIINAKWVAYPSPRTIRITNLLGMTDEEPAPGYAEFSVKAKTVHLEPVTGDAQLFFMFEDTTNGGSTYGAGRFVYPAMPKDGRVVIDFNQAHNPPCAFTAFATCPLPPWRNTLNLPVEAGEKNYGNHHYGRDR